MNKTRIAKWMVTVSVTAAVLGGLVASTKTAQAAPKLKLEYKNDKSAKKDATLRIGYADDGSFKGVFSPELSNDAATSEVSQFGTVGLFKVDDNYKFVKGGLADVDFDRENKTATIKVSDKANWSDGQPVVARDLVFAYEIIANKESGSARYTDQLANIVGMEEYHAGKADAISGLEVKDDKTLVVHFKEMAPTMGTSGAGYIWEYAEPYHYLKDVAMKDLASNDKLRKEPLFYGPFKIKKMVQGESIEWVPNTDYSQKPKVKKLTVETVSTSQAAAAVKAGKYDILLNQTPQVYDAVKNEKDFVQLGKPMLYYSYMGFRVGTVDKDGNSVMDKTAVTKDRALRQAMAYAMNIDQVQEKFGYGLSYRANTLVPAAFGKWNDKHATGYKLNMKKAKALLDEAGYKVQKDGYRTQPNGKKLTLTLMANKSSKNFEASVKNYIQQWKELGVRVKLMNGRFQEFNSMSEKLISGAKDFDIWMGAWSTSSEPTDVAANYSKTSAYNFGHFVTKENTELINSLSSEKAFDENYRRKQLYKWQEYMNKEAFIVPMTFTHSTISVSKDVKGMTLDVSDSDTLWSNVALTK